MLLTAAHESIQSLIDDAVALSDVDGLDLQGRQLLNAAIKVKGGVFHLDGTDAMKALVPIVEVLGNGPVARTQLAHAILLLAQATLAASAGVSWRKLGYVAWALEREADAEHHMRKAYEAFTQLQTAED